MKEFRPHSQNWNEFQWEQEIRRDERRISCYYRELPECLDLPGEEEMIFNSLLSRPDLVPTGGAPDSLRSWRPGEEDDDDDEPLFDDNSRRPGSELIIQLDHLAVEWNTLAVSRLRAGLELPGLGICCAFGAHFGFGYASVSAYLMRFVCGCALLFAWCAVFGMISFAVQERAAAALWCAVWLAAESSKARDWEKKPSATVMDSALPSTNRLRVPSVQPVRAAFFA